MRSLKHFFIVFLVLTASHFSAADELDDFLDAFQHKKWDECLRLAPHINPMERFILGEEGETELETTALFFLLFELDEEERIEDIVKRIELLILVVPRINPNEVLDLSERTAFETFVDAVAKMDIFREFEPLLLNLFEALLDRGAIVTERAEQAIHRIKLFRNALRAYRAQHTAPEETRDRSPARQRPRPVTTTTLNRNRVERPRSRSHNFHITISPAVRRSPRQEGPDSALAPLSPLTPGSAPDRMVPDAPGLVAPRTGVDPMDALQGMFMQMQRLLQETRVQMNNFELRLTQAEQREQRMQETLNDQIAYAVEQALRRLGVGSMSSSSSKK